MRMEVYPSPSFQSLQGLILTQNTTDNISITKDGKVLNFSIDEAKDLKNRLEDFLNGMDTN